jgi:hypothetical protein
LEGEDAEDVARAGHLPGDAVNVTPDIRLQTLAGAISPDEGRELRHLAALVPADRAIVELGAGRGKSTCYLSVGSREGHGARIWSIDLWGSHLNREYARRGELARRMFGLQLALEGVRSLVTPVQASTFAAGMRWSGPPIGLLFVDGGHSYEQVRDDLMAWLPHRSGIVALHDWGDDFPGVARAGDEALSEPARIIDTLAIYDQP